MLNIKKKKYYQNRINKALKFINENLGKKIQINEVAKAACFSEFHFQRLYKAMQNETPYETILRLRLEKAIFLLKHYPHKKIIEIALECGFESVENFTRQFKARFETSPSNFKKNKNLQNSRIYQEKNEFDFYNSIELARKSKPKKFDVIVDDLPSIKIAFIRAIFGNDGSILIDRYQELMKWAKKNNLKTTGPLTRFGMSIDNPDVTPANKYRYDFAISVNDKLNLEQLIEIGEIPDGKYATVHCIGKLEDVAQVWDHLYKEWLPNSKYVPKHYPALEEFIQGPEEIGWEQFNIKCRIPIEKYYE